MFAQVKKPKMNIDVKIGKGNSKMSTGKAVSGLKNKIEDLAKPAKIDTNVSINKKKGVRVRL